MLINTDGTFQVFSWKSVLLCFCFLEFNDDKLRGFKKICLFHMLFILSNLKVVTSCLQGQIGYFKLALEQVFFLVLLKFTEYVVLV